MKREMLLELGRKLLWDKWQNSSDELASVAIASLMDAGMLVEPGGAAELVRLRARVAEYERPAIEAQRNEIRDVLNTSRAEAEQDRDFEGAATVAQQLAEYEAKWAAEDAPPAPPRGASEIKHPAIRRTRAHFADNPLPTQRTGGDAA